MKRKILHILGIIKILIYKLIGFNIQFKLSTFMHPSVCICGSKKCKIIFGHKCNLMKNMTINVKKNCLINLSDKTVFLENCYIEVGENASLIVESETFVNRNCRFVCLDQIKIGKHCAFGDNVKIYDHDHIVKSCGSQNWNIFKHNPVVIGDETWICSSVTILRKSVIGNHSIVGAGTIVKGSVPDGTMCYSQINLQYKKID